MALQEILTERRGQTLILTFNRPEHGNAMTLDMASQMFTVLKNATTDASVRAVLLRGAGADFMDGLDMGFYTRDVNAALENANQLIQPFHNSIRELQSMDKPVLAAVKGRVSGVGFSMMLAADLVITSDKTRFSAGFADTGMSPTGGTTYFLSRKVGTGRAIEILMLSEPFDPERANRLRLVNRTVPDDQLEQESLVWLDQLAKGPTRAYGAIKKLANKAFEQDLNAQLGLEHTYFGHCSRSFDFREALRAHAEKREARFTGT